jgi:plasmid stabilization system protein ParE
MASYKVILLELAVAEIEEACEYYNQKAPNLGFEFEEEVFSLLSLIKDNPFLFPVKFAHIHEAVLSRFPFVVNYEIIDKQILISAVFHQKRNPAKKIKRKRK